MPPQQANNLLDLGDRLFGFRTHVQCLSLRRM